MTISAYQVDNIIKAYNKQSKAKVGLDAQKGPTPDKYADFVTLSGNDSMRADANKKISYSLLDVLKKENRIAL